MLYVSLKTFDLYPNDRIVTTKSLDFNMQLLIKNKSNNHFIKHLEIILEKQKEILRF